MGIATVHSGRNWNGWHFAALLGGNFALALGPLWVRLADCGPVSAAFWRLLLAVPVFVLFARATGQPVLGLPRKVMLALAGAGVFFALDLGSWHLGIGLTRLGNATLFGNSGSILLVVWGLIVLRRRPRSNEWLAFAAALGGSAILLGRSLEIDHATLIGDLLCLLAGFLYTFYILLLQNARASLGNWSLLTWSSASSAAVLLGLALLLGEPVWPRDWGPVLALALTSQVIGQGLLVYALKHFSPLIVGLALLTQPVVSVVLGWFWFGEVLSPLDGLGMVLVSAGLVLARSTQK
ncbi:DMT family transporter [Novosphingobium sp. B 225]|uniref:DMT family transporter n=1 Tax=Novosphingobium sp. B 225 TaxID=1961849 RepID=UPI000B4BD61C|nr:DMT family transporter [Novosphingobium sp. B 225]